MLNQKLAKKLHKPIIKRNEKRKVHSFFMEDIYKDLADMEFISKFEFDTGFQVFIDIYSKYTWDVPFEDKKRITITNAFKNVLDESNRKPNKTWVDKGS